MYAVCTNTQGIIAIRTCTKEKGPEELNTNNRSQELAQKLQKKDRSGYNMGTDQIRERKKRGPPRLS